MVTLWQDLRYGVRMLVRSPGFTAVAVLTLALGIGANTALFSIVNGVLLNPLPYPHPYKVVTVDSITPDGEGSVSYPDLADWIHDNHTFSSLAGYKSFQSFNWPRQSEAESIAFTGSIRNAIHDFNSRAVLFDTKTMDSIVSHSLASRRFAMILLAIFAGLALVLASIGIYGVLSYIAGQRTHEIGIRIALGAQQRDILKIVLGHGTRLALVGVVIGLAASAGLTRLMTAILYGVSATDPLTFAIVAVLLTLVALAACYIPARRAMRVDPIVALRYE